MRKKHHGLSTAPQINTHETNLKNYHTDMFRLMVRVVRYVFQFYFIDRTWNIGKTHLTESLEYNKTTSESLYSCIFSNHIKTKLIITSILYWKFQTRLIAFHVYLNGHSSTDTTSVSIKLNSEAESNTMPVATTLWLVLQRRKETDSFQNTLSLFVNFCDNGNILMSVGDISHLPITAFKNFYIII
jgi:hypothetical protein